MLLLHLILVALIQGITEFLPISSSGHLILLPALTGLEDQGQAVDVAVHVGTLGAVMLYFRKETAQMLRGLPKVARRQIDDQDAWLALCLIVATIPVIIAGFILAATGLNDALRSVAVVGWATLIFGIVLYFADQRGPSEKTSANWSLKDAFTMGLWQVIALIPGSSRSGITIIGARALGYAREVGATTVGLTTVRGAALTRSAEITIAPAVGPEVLAGSTRLKSGTAQKMVLNMISTAAMIRIGKTYQNMMVDLSVSNEKLATRAVGILCEATGASPDEARVLLEESGNDLKRAILMKLTGLDAVTARTCLAASGGVLRAAIEARQTRHAGE